jgi:hypothetical protein
MLGTEEETEEHNRLDDAEETDENNMLGDAEETEEQNMLVKSVSSRNHPDGPN